MATWNERKPSNADAKELFLSDLSDLEDRVGDTWNELEEARQRLNEDHKKLAQILGRYKKLKGDLQMLNDAYNGNDEDAKELHQSLNADTLDTDEVDTRLSVLREEMAAIHENKMRVGSMWLRFLVGRVNMRVWDDSGKMQLKTEYHKFKQRTNYVFLVFPILQLIWSRYYGEYSWVINQWHQTWLLYYYITLTTREFILRLNGSRLHFWWIAHHQISVFASFVSIILMRSAFDRYEFLFEFIIWMSLVVGLLQLWTNKFQLSRHYVRLALGKDQSEDIALTESIVNDPNMRNSISFILLKMACYTVYVLESLVGGYVVWKIFWNDRLNGHSFDLFQFEAYLCGVCFFILGLGNTCALYTRPFKHMRRSGSRERFSGIEGVHGRRSTSPLQTDNSKKES